jgi:hypothetical protein
MVVLSLRNRQNRECVDEDLRANKKVFERTQQQIAIMPQSEMPPNDKLQAIAFQFNKDIENVKNALNDGLTDMNSPDAIDRGFADFSKVSLAWNKLVARVNPYIKGQQTDPDFQAATAGDYNYVRQKLKDDLLQFFQNAIQQINSFKQGLAAQGGVARVQNEASLQDIVQQLSTGFYKNVRYGAEARTSLLIPRLPADVQQGQPPAPQPAPPQQQQQPAPAPAQPAQYDAQQFPQEAAEGNVDNALLNQAINPYVAAQGEPQQMALARQQELDGINARMVADINAFERQNGYINNPLIDPADVLNAFVDDTRDELQQFYQLQDDDEVDGFLAGIVDELGDYRRGVGRYAQQQGQPAPAPQQQQGQPAPAPPAPTPPRRGRPVDMNRQQAIFDKANELGIYQQLSGYSRKSQAERQRVAPIVRQLATSLGISPEALKRNLNQMVGFGMKGGFLGSLIGDVAGDLYRGATGKSFGSDLLSLGKMAFNNRGVIGDALKQKFMSLGKGASSRGHPLRLNNDFTGTSVVPNTLAELKNRMRVAKDGDYVGDSTGAIIPNLQNRGVLGSGRRSRRLEGGFITIPSDMLNPDGSRDDWEEVEGSDITGSYDYPKSLSQKARELIATQGSRILQAAMNRFIQVATATPQAAMDAARATSAGAAAALPVVIQALQRAKDAAAAGASATRDVYQHEATQAVINYVSAHPEVLANYWGLGTGFVVGTATGLVRQYLKRGMRGNGRCCFNSGMCRGTKAYRFNYGQKSANVRKESVRGRGGSANEEMLGGGNGVNVNIKYSKLPKALQPTEEDLNPTPRPRSVSGGVRRRRMPKESYEGFQDEENDVYTHRGGIKEASPLVHSEMLQDKALGLLKGLPRRLGVEDPKFKPKK